MHPAPCCAIQQGSAFPNCALRVEPSPQRTLASSPDSCCVMRSTRARSCASSLSFLRSCWSRSISWRCSVPARARGCARAFAECNLVGGARTCKAAGQVQRASHAAALLSQTALEGCLHRQLVVQVGPREEASSTGRTPWLTLLLVRAAQRGQRAVQRGAQCLRWLVLQPCGCKCGVQHKAKRGGTRMDASRTGKLGQGSRSQPRVAPFCACGCAPSHQARPAAAQSPADTSRNAAAVRPRGACARATTAATAAAIRAYGSQAPLSAAPTTIFMKCRANRWLSDLCFLQNGVGIRRGARGCCHKQIRCACLTSGPHAVSSTRAFCSTGWAALLLHQTHAAAASRWEAHLRPRGSSSSRPPPR